MLQSKLSSEAITSDRLPDDWLPEGFTIQEVETNGVRLSYAVGGAGKALFLIHGWPQTSRAWRSVMGPLAEAHMVIVPDLRGAGNSDRPAEGYEKANQVEDLRGLRDKLKLSGPAVVVGHDIGAMIAWSWAAQYPEEIAALVLMEALLPGLGLEALMDSSKGGMFHFGLFMTPEVPEMLIAGHEGDFMQWWFDKMTGHPDLWLEQMSLLIRRHTPEFHVCEEGSHNIAPCLKTRRPICG